MCIRDSLKRLKEVAFKLADLVQRNIPQQAVRAAIKNGNLLFYRHRAVLGLYHEEKDKHRDKIVCGLQVRKALFGLVPKLLAANPEIPI